MCRNISNMLFVLFPVVLCLAASKGERSSFNAFHCYRALSDSGHIYCQLSGYDLLANVFEKLGLHSLFFFSCGLLLLQRVTSRKKSKSKGLDYETCELKCEGGTVDLPEEACSYDGVQSGCTKDLVVTLKKWSADMRKRKDDLIKKMVH
uniref:Putative conserved secreted protein n=1 Tax=Ixodes ricinus TaxID=34613 RepID=A0A6B0UUQ7_IXORI